MSLDHENRDEFRKRMFSLGSEHDLKQKSFKARRFFIFCDKIYEVFSVNSYNNKVPM